MLCCFSCLRQRLATEDILSPCEKFVNTVSYKLLVGVTQFLQRVRIARNADRCNS